MQTPSSLLECSSIWKAKKRRQISAPKREKKIFCFILQIELYDFTMLGDLYNYYSVFSGWDFISCQHFFLNLVRVYIICLIIKEFIHLFIKFGCIPLVQTESWMKTSWYPSAGRRRTPRSYPLSNVERKVLYGKPTRIPDYVDCFSPQLCKNDPGWKYDSNRY